MRATLLATVCLLLVPAAWAQSSPPKDLTPCPTSSDAPDVAALVERLERTQDGRSSVAVMSMSIKTPDWQRTVKMKVWSRGRDFALVRVLEGGPRETGMMTLKRERQLWNFLPQAGRVMKLPSGMMGDSWMGSDFTNDDLVKGSSLVSDYTATVDRTVETQGRAAWFITLKPRPSATVVWSRVELLMDRTVCAPLEQRFYDDDGKLARTLVHSELIKVGWRQFPSRLTVAPTEGGRQTQLKYESIEFDVDIPDDTFSLKRLQQGRD